MNTQEDDSLLFHGNAGKNKLLWYGGLALFVAWNILLFILAVVAIAKANNVSGSSGSTYTYAPTTRGFTVGPQQSISGGSKVVSLLPSGNIRLGGGTTVFLERGLKPNITTNSQGLVGITFNPPASGTVISLQDSELAFVAYTDAAGKVWGTLGKVGLQGTSVSTWSKPQQIEGLTATEACIPLNRFTGPKKSFVLAGAGKLVVGVVESEATNDLRFTVSAVQTYKGTSNTLLARLNDKTFALAYFTLVSLTTKQHLMQATVGNVSFDASGNFESLKFAPAFNYSATNGAYHAMFPLVQSSTTATEFVLAYPSASAILINSTNAPDDTLVVLKGRWNEEQDTLTFGPTNVLSGVKPTAMMTATVLPTTPTRKEPKGVIVFVNEHENNALTAVVVRKSATTFTKPDQLEFASTLKIADGVASPAFQVRPDGSVVPFITAHYIDDTNLAVSFSDFANLGKVTTTVLTLNHHTFELSIANGGTKYVVNEPNPNFTSDYWWVAGAPLKFSTQIGYVLWQYLQTNNENTEIVTQSIVEVAPPPFGILTEKTSAKPGDSAQVVVSGVYKFTAGSPPFNNLVGRFWYTDTLGELHYRAGNDTSSGGYVVTDDGKLISTNARFGVSISNNELLLINNFD